MTEQEKNEIVDLIYGRLEAGWKPSTQAGLHKTLAAPRDKWFRDDHNSGYDSLMTQVIGSPQKAWQVWELIRRLTCIVCGAQYVRDIKDPERASAVADEICETVYRLANRHDSGKDAR